MKILNIVGARPNFMKIAPLVRQMERRPQIEWKLVHTGQHYDDAMSKVFFEELGLPAPHVFLGVGSGSQAEQTAQIMMRFEPVLQQEQPDLALVVGDTNSTLACALTAAKCGVRVAHVEAGLRSFDRTMPEEINRIVTDALSDHLFTTSRIANENLKREGIPEAKVHFVGNVMIDTLLALRERAAQSPILDELELRAGEYAILTLHRPSNVDTPEALAWLIETVEDVQERLPIVFPVHPRTRSRLKEFGLVRQVEQMRHIKLTPPLGYVEFLKLMFSAKVILTDSGGIQEETTVLGVPCLTLRSNTERPETVKEGTNILVGRDRARVLWEVDNVLAGHGKVGRVPELWDGRAAERIVDLLGHRS